MSCALPLRRTRPTARGDLSSGRARLPRWAHSAPVQARHAILLPMTRRGLISDHSHQSSSPLFPFLPHKQNLYIHIENDLWINFFFTLHVKPPEIIIFLWLHNKALVFCLTMRERIFHETWYQVAFFCVSVRTASINRWPHLFIDRSASIYRWPHLFIDGRIYL